MPTFAAASGVRGSFSLADDPVVGTRAEWAELATSQSVGHGTGPFQANAGIINRFTIPAGQTLQIDLQSIADAKFAFAGVVRFTVVKCLTAINQGTVPLLYGTPGVADATAYAARLEESGGSYQCAAWKAGVAVTNANRFIHVANPSATTAGVLDLCILGIGTYQDS